MSIHCLICGAGMTRDQERCIFCDERKTAQKALVDIANVLKRPPALHVVKILGHYINLDAVSVVSDIIAGDGGDVGFYVYLDFRERAMWFGQNYFGTSRNVWEDAVRREHKRLLTEWGGKVESSTSCPDHCGSRMGTDSLHCTDITCWCWKQ